MTEEPATAQYQLFAPFVEWDVAAFDSSGFDRYGIC